LAQNPESAKAKVARVGKTKRRLEFRASGLRSGATHVRRFRRVHIVRGIRLAADPDVCATGEVLGPSSRPPARSFFQSHGPAVLKVPESNPRYPSNATVLGLRSI
jgi:hypothetical protein